MYFRMHVIWTCGKMTLPKVQSSFDDRDGNCLVYHRRVTIHRKPEETELHTGYNHTCDNNIIFFDAYSTSVMIIAGLREHPNDLSQLWSPYGLVHE